MLAFENNRYYFRYRFTIIKCSMKNTIIILLIIILLTSCSNYYKVITINKSAASDVTTTLNLSNKFFILHNDSAVFSMENISLQDNNSKIKCTLSSLPDNHKLHMPRWGNKKLKYQNGKNEYDESGILNEVHLFLSSKIIFEVGINEITVDKVTKIEIIEKDKLKTRRSRVKGGIITAVATIGVAAIIINSSLQNWKY